MYTPPKKILENYANVLVNFALNNGKGIKKGDVVLLMVWESAKPLFIELRKAITAAGGHTITQYMPDDDDRFNAAKDFFTHASNAQLDFFPEKYYKGILDTIDHRLIIISDANKKALDGVDPKKIMRRGLAVNPAKENFFKKVDAGKASWSLAMYGTPAMAKEAGLSEKAYWGEIIHACYLREKDPVEKWKQTEKELKRLRDKLTKLKIERLHIKGADADLWIQLGARRAWKAGSGCNIPSFEVFTSPDWRGTEGWIKFNQPLYRYGNIIRDVRLEFKNGIVTKATASKGQKVLREMIASPNANKVGEFSLTDGRMSKITKFMAETLFDENVGGRQGNTHIALGAAYKDCFDGDPSKITKKQWEKLGYNESPVHTDIVSTAKRSVTAYLPGGKEKVIYDDGKFLV